MIHRSSGDRAIRLSTSSKRLTGELNAPFDSTHFSIYPEKVRQNIKSASMATQPVGPQLLDRETAMLKRVLDIGSPFLRLMAGGDRFQCFVGRHYLLG